MLQVSTENAFSKKYVLYYRRESDDDCTEHGESSVDMHTTTLEKADL